MLRKLSSTLRVGLALFLAVFSNSLLPTAAAYATAPSGSITLLPVWCQLTGSGWKAQQGTGDNTQRFPLMGAQSQEYGVVTTENLSLYPTAVVGQTLWKDSKGQIDRILDDACEAQYSTVTPTAPTVKADPCGTDSDMYTIPSKTGVIYKVGGVTKAAGDYATGGALSVTITAVADAGFVLEEGAASSWTLTFTNVSCVQTIAAPVVTPSVVCGPDNDTLALPTSAEYSLTSDSGWVAGTRTITWTTNAGFVFAGGLTTNTQVFTDTNTLCPPTEIALPTPTKTDPCGLNNAYWNEVQPTVDHVTWTLEEDGDLIATVVGNYTFPGGETSHNFGKAVDSNTPCPVTKPAAPAVNDPCGLNNATWTLPDDTDSLDWSLVNGVLSVQTKAGYEFTDHTTSIDFGTAADSGTLCNASAGTVEYTDVCGTANDTYTIPNTAHVIYKIGDVAQAPGTYPATGTVTIVAVAAPDYQLTAPYTFEYEFDNASCEKVTICHRDNNVKKPYVMIEVAKSAVDGLAGNNGKGQPDHYGEHQGPIATSEEFAQILKDNHIEWGDIIPPVEGVHDGYNWTEQGEAMWENGCNFVENNAPEVTVMTSPVCVDKGQTNGKITVKVTNPNNFSIEYKVVVDGTAKYVTVAADSSQLVDFTGFGAGTYDVEVFQKTQFVEVPEIEASYRLDQEGPVVGEEWTLVYETTVTIAECAGQIISETDVCPNLDGAQATVPAGYTKSQTTGECGKVLPATLPATGGASFISQWMPFVAAVLTYGITSFSRSRKQNA